MTPARLLAVLAVAIVTACAVAKGPVPPGPEPAPPSHGYPGFGFRTTGGAGRPVFVVRTLADAGPGSLRDALAQAASGGGTIRFAIGGGITLAAGLDVPAHTTIDGTSAPPPGITLWGEHTGARSTGVINIYESDVVVRGLRIRNGRNDGCHVAPHHGHAIANIVVEHCSLTNNADGGLDVTGYAGLPLTDVTIAGNYFAGNGGPCAKGTCGGASLMKYGATRISYYENFWDKDLRRTPSISAGDGGFEAIADIRYNVVRSPEQSGVQIRDGARANVIGNTLQGSKATIVVRLWGGHAYLRGNPGDLPRGGDIAEPLPVPGVPEPRSPTDVVAEAGALPRDGVDAYYVETATTFGQVKRTDAHALPVTARAYR